MTAPFPTRADEAYRYADIEALKRVWNDLAAPERIEIAAQQKVQQIWAPTSDDVQIRRGEVILAPGAELTLFALNIAPEYGRVELDVTLHEGACFTFDAANIGGANATLEVVTTVRHIEPSAVSRQTVRSVLGGKAVGSYLGKVHVARGAQQTDGEQSVKAMLLDRGATANCKPELEIYADDVKCAHGASVGELDKDQLFYAMSRGLDPASAKALLLEGFVIGLWDDVEDEVQRLQLCTATRDALQRVAA
ncbi:SufD family Fe-S cluster assembly protein [Sphingomonas piscis]|uniref:SufD family Fe-S cluster assembly protein n=1 Tax=Sphingomonas piscis TaxID=2714943 RepID=A0A6G7YP70_9SPHN|nr:SufD family Fe-S cluster assembly protein [Sphingomonas piscis]QIK78534.1 SufD family Fe-S cluster assembly protein [Sphingomonas piscis]